MSLLERFKLEDQEVERMSLNKTKFPKKEAKKSDESALKTDTDIVESESESAKVKQ